MAFKLSQFVDRRRELDRFRRMLDGTDDSRLLLIVDEGEQGKTWLIQRLLHECETHDPPIPVVHLDFKQEESGLRGDHYDIVSEVRRQLEEYTPARHIRACQEHIYHPAVVQTGAGTGEGVDFGEDNRFPEATIHSIAGRDVINYYAGPPPSGQEAWHAQELGSAMMEDLAALAGQYPRVVFLLDTFEQVGQEAAAWLSRYLFDPLRRRLSHLRVAVAGRPKCRSFFERNHRWAHLVVTIERLSRLDEQDVLEYYRRRGLSIPKTEHTLLLVAREKPMMMASIGDILERNPGGVR